MKNYLRHNFRSTIVFGRSRISVLGHRPQDINYSPLRNISSGYILEKNQIHIAATKEINEKEKKKSSWLNNLLMNDNDVNILKGGLLENKYKPFSHSCHAFKFGSPLKKTISDCNFFNIYKNENHKSAKNTGLYDTINCEDPAKKHELSNNNVSSNYAGSPKKLNLTNKLHSFIPDTTKCSNSIPYYGCNKSCSQCNNYLRSNFLKPCKAVPNNSSRGFSTLCIKSKSSKTILFGPHRSCNKVDSRQMMSKSIERDPGIVTKKLKKRDLDWINSFSSEAVILQPSREEFSIKKLINKTTCQERHWGLPHKQYFAKNTAPRINDNLVQYMALKQKMESEFKKNYFDGEGIGTSQKVKMLIKSAEEKNRQMELKKMKNHSTKSRGRKMLQTIKESINLKPIDILKTKEKTARNNETKYLQKTHKKRSILNFRLPNFKVNDTQNMLQKYNPPVTEYQSSASYKHVFQEIFNKASRTKLSPKPAVPLSVFNRQASHNFSRSVSKLSSDDSSRKKKILKKTEKSSTLPGLKRAVNLKNQARTPFQKPSNTQLTSKSIASFSTVSKFTKTTASPTASCPNLLKDTINKVSSQKVKSSERSICTNRKVNEVNQPVIKTSLYSTLGYIPVIPKRMDMKSKKKHRNTKNKLNGSYKNETKQEYKSHIRPANSNSGYFSQRRSLSSFGVLVGSMMETDGLLNNLTEPLNEQIFKEVMNLCKEQPAAEKKVSNSETEKKLKSYDRCSVQEKKKPERRRGFVCRLASMLNIGCGRRRRANQGCTQCGKKAS